MINSIANGNVLDYTNGTGSTIASGGVVVIGKRIGVAVTKMLDGETGAVNLTGAYGLPTAGIAQPQGTVVYWDTDAEAIVDAPNEDTVVAGILYKAALIGDTTVAVVLIQGAQSAVAANVAANGIVALDAVAGVFADLAAARAAVDALKTDVGTDLTALKASVNAIITALVDAGIMAA